MERQPYTHAELRAMLAQIQDALTAAERVYPEARPLPPLALEEVLGLLDAMVGLAGQRVLTRAEQFLVGQLHQALHQATLAEAMGRRGRYYVIAEDSVERLRFGRKRP